MQTRCGTSEITVSGDVTVNEMLEVFQKFMVSAGYCFKSTQCLELVDTNNKPDDGYIHCTGGGSGATLPDIDNTPASPEKFKATFKVFDDDAGAGTQNIKYIHVCKSNLIDIELRHGYHIILTPEAAQDLMVLLAKAIGVGFTQK